MSLSACTAWQRARLRQLASLGARLPASSARRNKCMALSAMCVSCNEHSRQCHTSAPASARRSGYACAFPHGQRLRIHASHVHHYSGTCHAPPAIPDAADRRALKQRGPAASLQVGQGRPTASNLSGKTPAMARRRAAGPAAGPTRPSCAARAGAPRPARPAAAGRPRRPRPPAAARPRAPARRPAARAAPRAPAGLGRIRQRVRAARAPHEARRRARGAFVCSAADAAGGCGQEHADAP